jgi:all-trans-retinol 13,14-reductase
MKSVAIIGGGLGGLSTGALLAKKGFKVTLLEQHSIVGGCATIFKRKGDFTCEVGLHEMDGVYTSPVIKKVFDEIGVYDHVEFIKADEFFKIYYKDSEFTMPDSKSEAIKALKDKFPNEHDAIDKYFKLLEDITKCYEKLEKPKWYELLVFPILIYPILKYKSKSVSEVLQSLTSNEELRLILNANVMYYNDSPDTLCFLLHAIAQNSYFEGGGYFIKGGSYKLSEYFAKVISDNGGEIITKANVIKASKNEVIYKKKKEIKSLKADIIISNISPQDTYKLYDMEYKEDKEISESITSVYLGFSKNLKEVYGKQSYSSFFFDDLSSDKQIDEMVKRDIEQRGFAFVDYSQIDAGLTPREKSFAEVALMDELSTWENLDKDEYKNKKEKLANSVLDKLELHYPNIKELVELVEVGTPKTMQRYIKTPKGTAYGFKPSLDQYFRIPKVKSEKIDNLYFTGQFVLGGGFSACIISGSMCFEKVLKDS